VFVDHAIRKHKNMHHTFEWIKRRDAALLRQGAQIQTQVVTQQSA